MTTKVEKPIDDILDLIEGTATGTPAPEDLELIAHCYEAMAMAEGDAPDAEDAWRQFEARQRGRRMRRTMWWSALAAAAAVALLVVMVHAWMPGEETLYTALEVTDTVTIRSAAHEETMPIRKLGARRKVVEELRYKTVVVPDRQDYHLTLSDGTEVWLNAGTRFTYPEHFAAAGRAVSVEGEAFFHVAHDASRPFVVQAGGLSTVVTGTQFDVRNYEGESPCVTLVEGSVTVHGGGMEVPIVPGEGAVLEQSRLHVAQADVEAHVAWRDGLLYFQDTSLRDILMELGRWYNLNVVCRDKAEIQGRYHFACDRKDTPANAVALLREVTGEHIYIEGNTIFVQK